MKHRAVIFDLFGTLVNNRSVTEYERVLSDMAAILSIRAEKFVSLWGETFPLRATGFFPNIETNIEHICQLLDVQVEPVKIMLATKIRLDFTRRALKPREGADEILGRLQSAHYKTGLISNCAPDIPLLWPDTSFSSLIDVPIFSCNVGLKKPDLHIYELAYERLRVIPQDCIYVGDGGSHELRAASQVGMKPVLICVDQTYVDDPYRKEAVGWKGLKITSLKELLTLMD